MNTSRHGLFLRPEFVFLAFAVVFGSILLLITPPVSGLDEHTHIARIDQLAHLNLKSDFIGNAPWYHPDEEGSAEDTALFGGEVDSEFWAFVSSNLDKTHSTDSYYQLPLSRSSGHYEYESEGRSDVVAFSNTGVNSPIVYAPQLLGYVLGRAITSSVFWVYFAARFAGFAFFVAASFWCIRQIPIAKWACVALFLSPAVFLGAIPVTADTVTFSCICLFFATVLRIAAVDDDSDPSPSDWAQLVVFSLLLSGIKATYIPVLGLMVILPIVRPSFRARRRFLALVAIVLATMALFGGWYLYAIRSVNTGAMWNQPLVSPHKQVAYVLAHPTRFLGLTLDALANADVMQVTGSSFAVAYRASMSGFGFPVPAWLVTITYVLAIAVSEEREHVSERFARLLPVIAGVLLVISILSLVLICAALYVSFTPVGRSTINGLQNRYYVPVAFCILCAIAALVFRVRMAIERRVLGSPDENGAAGAGERGVGDAAYSSVLARRRAFGVGLKILTVLSLLVVQVLVVAFDYFAYIR